MILWIVLTVQTVLVFISIWVFPLKGLVMCFHCCCSSTAHLALLIATLIMRFNDEGDKCANNKEVYWNVNSPDPEE